MDNERLERLRAIQRRRKELIAEIDECTRLLRSNANDAALFYRRANAHRTKGDLIAAVCDYNRAVRINPAFAEAHFYKAIACAALGNRYEEIKAHREFLASAGNLGRAVLDRVQRRLSQLESRDYSRRTAH